MPLMADSRSRPTYRVNTSYVCIQTHLPGLAEESLYVLFCQDLIHRYDLFVGTFEYFTILSAIRSLLGIIGNLEIRTCKSYTMVYISFVDQLIMWKFAYSFFFKL